jgi:hypothetical protein
LLPVWKTLVIQVRVDLVIPRLSRGNWGRIGIWVIRVRRRSISWLWRISRLLAIARLRWVTRLRGVSGLRGVCSFLGVQMLLCCIILLRTLDVRICYRARVHSVTG